jgi:hypothetical protein
MDTLPITPLPCVLGGSDSSRPGEMPEAILKRRGQPLTLKLENFPSNEAYQAYIKKHGKEALVVRTR